LDAAVLVCEDFLRPAGADYNCRLRAAHYRLRCCSRWSERQSQGYAREVVVILERWLAAGLEGSAALGEMGDGGQYVGSLRLQGLGLSIAWACGQSELVSGNQLPAIAGAMNDQAGNCFLLHANVCRPLVVLENLLQLGGLVAAALVNAIEALGVSARPIV